MPWPPWARPSPRSRPGCSPASPRSWCSATTTTTPGRLATQRALELLNNSEFTVKVLQLPNRMVDGQPVKQDADDFIKYHGAAAFERLLSGSENGVEFRMAQMAAKYDLTDDEQPHRPTPRDGQRAVAALDNAVEREIYTDRAAETAGIVAGGHEAGGAAGLQAPRRPGPQGPAAAGAEPDAVRSSRRSRAIRYDDLRSAMAEEGVIRLLMLDDSLFPDQPPLREDEFSSPLLGRSLRGSAGSMPRQRQPAWRRSGGQL